MNFFEEATLRLKQQLKVTEDKQVAEALGLTSNAWTLRKRRFAFPKTELYALAAKRSDLKIDVAYVLTGITSEATALLEAKQARIARAVDAGLSPEEVRAQERVQGPGPSPERIRLLAEMLPGLRAAEFEAVFTQVESITQLREALQEAKKPQ
ncbi:ci repressor [Vitreoscilla filiformis]|jgi:alkanesulfonate monooxygenase SsuD/methylene tetrahydromethanopterin reductase-like flavin-dependent oxidoreductase (luciferase family)|uniref:Ci repressor n=1 Tax=Vitreoscilla filiformis TaxID=63 RepID=A0A221KC42_VITFI|nr:hypothetical protein [Vitreoscilla filiformis]ASM76397.1 ci repressor [Vitreoscilla filiformis]